MVIEINSGKTTKIGSPQNVMAETSVVPPVHCINFGKIIFRGRLKVRDTRPAAIAVAAAVNRSANRVYLSFARDNSMSTFQLLQKHRVNVNHFTSNRIRLLQVSGILVTVLIQYQG